MIKRFAFAALLLACMANTRCEHKDPEVVGGAHRAPEIDPGSAVAALTLLAGLIFVIADVRRKP